MTEKTVLDIKREIYTPPPDLVQEFSNVSGVVPKIETNYDEDQSSSTEVLGTTESNDEKHQSKTDMSYPPVKYYYELELEEHLRLYSKHNEDDHTIPCFYKRCPKYQPHSTNPKYDDDLTHLVNLKIQGRHFPEILKYLRERRDELQITPNEWIMAQRLHDIWICPVCSDIIQWNIILTCHHRFCSNCLTGQETECPICDVTIKSVRREQFMEDFGNLHKLDLFRKKPAHPQPENPFAWRNLPQWPIQKNDEREQARNAPPVVVIPEQEIKLELDEEPQTVKKQRRSSKRRRELDAIVKVEEPVTLRRSPRIKQEVVYFKEEIEDDY